MKIESNHTMENTNLETIKNSRSVELLCPKCKKSIPSIEEISISSKKIPLIRLNCQCLISKKAETLDLGEYLHFLSSVDQNQNVCFKHQDTPSTVFCKSCSLYMCSLCHSYHMDFEPSHVTISIEAAKTQTPYCRIHSKHLLNYFCEDCNDNICGMCTRSNHYTHRVIELKEYWETVNNKLGDRSHEEVTLLIKNQISTFDVFIQKKLEKINELIYNLQQIKQKLEHSAKLMLKANKTIGLFISCVFSDFFKGEYSPNFMIIQNVERISFEELCSHKEENYIFKQFSIVDEAINIIFNNGKDSLNRIIAKITPKSKPLILLKNQNQTFQPQTIQALKTQTLQALQNQTLSALQTQTPQALGTQALQTSQIFPIQSQIQVQGQVQAQVQAQVQTQVQGQVQSQITNPIIQVSSLNNKWQINDGNNQMRNTIRTTNCSTHLSNDDIMIKTIRKEEILKTLNLDPTENKDILFSNFLQDKKPKGTSNFLKQKKKRNQQINKSITNTSQDAKSNSVSEAKQNIIKVPINTNPYTNYFIIDKERKNDASQKSENSVVNQSINLKKPNSEFASPLMKKKQGMIKGPKSDITNKPSEKSISKNSNNLFFEEEDKFKLSSASKESKKKSIDMMRENKLFQNDITDNSHENVSNFFNHTIEDNFLRTESQNVHSEFKMYNNNQYEQCLITIKEHNSSVKAIFQLNSGKLISGGKDNVINIFNNDNNYECESKITTNDFEINCLLELFDGGIAVGFNDNSIKIYDLLTNNCTIVLIGHSKPVVCIFQKEVNTLLSCSDDHTIKMWDLTTKNCLLTFNEHIDGVTGIIQISDLVMVSISKDLTMKQWKYSEIKSIYTLKAHSAPITKIIKLFNDQLATASSDKTIKLWDMPPKTCIGILNGHKGCISSIVQLEDGSLASVSFDTTMKIWDLKTMSCINTIIVSSQKVNAIIQLFDNSIVTGSDDSLIKLWV